MLTVEPDSDKALGNGRGQEKEGKAQLKKGNEKKDCRHSRSSYLLIIGRSATERKSKLNDSQGPQVEAAPSVFFSFSILVILKDCYFPE